ncbi:MAG: tetratricopeptide repeat protein [Neisseria sp.]|nr:tetratricopeptide repeat protein [Neisseria sp.]
MFFWKTRVRPVAVAFLLVCSSGAYAATAASAQVETLPQDWKTISKPSRYTDEERASEYQRRGIIIDRANDMFTLLGGEMALQKGEAGTALATYMVMLDRTKDPEVAERAMDMAVSLHAYAQAEAIFQKWREIEPVPGEAQKRMAWARSLVTGNVDEATRNLNDVLAHADETQARRIFLLLAQMSVQQPNLAAKAGRAVHRAAKKYPDMPEAAIADAVFSAQNGKEKDAVSALQTLAGLDAEILPPTELTLRLVAQRSPEAINRFFAETNTQNLSPMWQELEVSSLIASGRMDQAYSRLQTLLNQSPNADLYIQAALLSVARGDDLSVVNSYLDKAYTYGTQEQQSRAAIIGAMRNAEAKDYPQARVWADKITAADYVFDKAVLRASMEAEQGNWRNALAETRRAQRLPEQQGRFFSAADLQRVYLFALSKHDNPTQALAELNKLIAETEKQPDAEEQLGDMLYQRGMVYADKLQQPQKAVADLRRYLELNPGSANGMNALGYTMLSLPAYNMDEAFGLIQAAYQMEPESAAINDSMGWAYYLKGDAQAALPYLQYAFEQYPDAEVAAHLGEVLWKLDEQEQAKSVFAQGLKMEGNVALLKRTIQRLGVKLPAAAAVKR